jgi:queuine tRNA-ribosyltransferase
VKTPVFMPVGTYGAVKAISHDMLHSIGYRIILGNTYHLFLRPGLDVIENSGGLHRFSSWSHNILTDSGGFQVFSLAQYRKIKDEGVWFQSHIDGANHFFSPELVVDIQKSIGSDIIMPLDVCTSPDASYEESRRAVEITRDWARRSKERHLFHGESISGTLFGIIQGNFFKDLRRQSIMDIVELDFPGIAIGGLSVGETFPTFCDFLAFTAEALPKEKPRYVMGIGTPEFILEAVENGVDLFDCVFPTRIARNGAVFTRKGIISLKKEDYKYDLEPIEADCTCVTCRNYSRSYLRHLIKTKEMLGPMLTTYHNLFFMHTFMEEVRRSIEQGTFLSYKRDFLADYKVEKDACES